MSLEQFKEGNIVRLKSGGPDMTIVNIDKDGWLMCNWFEGNKVHSGRFPSSALRIIPEEAEVFDYTGMEYLGDE